MLCPPRESCYPPQVCGVTQTRVTCECGYTVCVPVVQRSLSSHQTQTTSGLQSSEGPTGYEQRWRVRTCHPQTLSNFTGADACG